MIVLIGPETLSKICYGFTTKYAILINKSFRLMIMMRTFLLSLLFLSSGSFAQSWHCKNSDFEIYCGAKGCEVNSDGFTPMSIQLQQNGQVGICAYSGCWEGQAKVLVSQSHWLFSAHDLQWQGLNQDTASFMLAVDQNTQTGFIQGEGFAMPMQCEESK